MLSALGNIVNPVKSETALTPFTYSLDFDSLKKAKNVSWQRNYASIFIMLLGSGMNIIPPRICSVCIGNHTVSSSI